MNGQANLEVMRRTLDAFLRGDVASLSALISPEIIWHVPGRNPLAKDYRGHAEVFGFFGKLMEGTGGTFRLESIDMLANERGGVYIDRARAERAGKSLEVMLILRVTIRDGCITEGWDCFHQEQLWDSFWE
jgi:ketosteroid isomerase-like protein